MRRTIASLLATISLLLAALGAPAIVNAACGAGTITFYDGASGSGARTYAQCADYGYAWSFDQGAVRFTDGTNVDNRISSIRFSTTVPDNYDFKAYASYYFNAGDTWTLTNIGSITLINVPSLLNNRISSWKNLGS